MRYNTLQHFQAYIVEVQFDDTNWTIESDGITYSVKIADATFLNAVQKGKLSFGKRDVLDVDLVCIVTEKNGKQVTEYEVSKVYSLSE